jgi:hypothetical protein
MKLITLWAAVLLLAIPATALALSFESFGNTPPVARPGWDASVLGVVNLNSRVYSLWEGEGGVPTFFYRGDARALNEAIGKFAAVKVKERRLILLPGRGKTYSFDRTRIDFDWRLNFSLGDQVVMTAFVSAEKPRGPVDRKKVETWLRDLDDDSFATRQAASRGLEKLGIAAKPLLREALRARPPLEVRRRIETLLTRFKGLDVDDLEVPNGLTVVTANDLLQAHLKALSGADQTGAMFGLVELASYSDKVVPALTARLKKGKGGNTRQVAAYCLTNIGAGARAAVPALKAGLDDPDPGVRGAFQSAIERIGKAKEEPGWGEEVKKRRAILKDLDEWKKGRSKS